MFPLRERKEDVPQLAQHYINQFNSQFRKDIKNISSDAEKLLVHYEWPGNIRELRNVIERAILLENSSSIQIENLPSEIKNIPAFEYQSINPYQFIIPETGISLEELEKQIIKQALDKTDNNQSKASRLLGISRDTLRYKQKETQALNISGLNDPTAWAI